MKMSNGSRPNIPPPQFYKTSAQKEVWKILSRDVVPIMDDWNGTEEIKYYL